MITVFALNLRIVQVMWNMCILGIVSMLKRMSVKTRGYGAGIRG